jgi:hypothetical protein
MVANLNTPTKIRTPDVSAHDSSSVNCKPRYESLQDGKAFFQSLSLCLYLWWDLRSVVKGPIIWGELTLYASISFFLIRISTGRGFEPSTERVLKPPFSFAREEKCEVLARSSWVVVASTHWRAWEVGPCYNPYTPYNPYHPVDSTKSTEHSVENSHIQRDVLYVPMRVNTLLLWKLDR